MSVFGKMIKRGISSAAVGTYDLVSDIKSGIKTSYELAQKEDLKEDMKRYNEMMEHMSEDEKKKIENMSKHFSMVDMAKKQAKARNKFAFLDHKYKSVEKIEEK